MIPGGVESNSTSACCFAGEVLAADHLPRTFNRPVFLSSFRDAGPATKNPTQHTSCISHRSVVDPTLCTASTLSMPVAAGVKGFTREVNTASTVGMAKGCAEGRLDDLRGLLVADDGLEGKALSTVTVSQVPVDQAAGAGQTKVKSEERSYDRSLSESLLRVLHVRTRTVFFPVSYCIIRT